MPRLYRAPQRGGGPMQCDKVSPGYSTRQQAWLQTAEIKQLKEGMHGRNSPVQSWSAPLDPSASRSLCHRQQLQPPLCQSSQCTAPANIEDISQPFSLAWAAKSNSNLDEIPLDTQSSNRNHSVICDVYCLQQEVHSANGVQPAVSTYMQKI